MNRRIYFAGSIRGGREDAALYKRIIDYITPIRFKKRSFMSFLNRTRILSALI